MRRYQRDTAIATKGAGLWADLCTTVRESAEGFNRYYGKDRPVACELVNNRLRLTKEPAPESGSPQPPMLATPVQTSVEFSQYSKGVQIVRTMPRPGVTPNPAVKKWEFYFDADNDGELFFTDERNRRLSTDALAQEVLEEWMFAK
jgi:hypothetical protein